MNIKNIKEAREIIDYKLNLGDMSEEERRVLADAIDHCTRNFAKGYLERDAQLQPVIKELMDMLDLIAKSEDWPASEYAKEALAKAKESLGEWK